MNNEVALICAQCKEPYYIDPCNTNGLQTTKKPKEEPKS